ncbi:hypothetical protein EXD71_03855 [Klebsiella pneumoniae]|nr:hypothetical protein CPL67_08605 [Klebsiella pneumoniae]PTA55696.1 hypothetical protein C9I61_10915 [Klebsiella pneumoniae]RZF73598.1 hypothetical protein EXD72_06760 [Klebsiella pneumoniae]RZF76100.1 hypothetical protein EXD71_03855 [Klebsiella pneumoniae]
MWSESEKGRRIIPPGRRPTSPASRPAKRAKPVYTGFLILFPGWCILASRRAIGHWLILLLLSVLFSSLLLRIHLPAALLLGPLIAGLILSLRGVKLSIPRPCYLAAQAIVGCMIARRLIPLFLACCSTTGRWCWRSC